MKGLDKFAVVAFIAFVAYWFYTHHATASAFMGGASGNGLPYFLSYNTPNYSAGAPLSGNFITTPTATGCNTCNIFANVFGQSGVS
jgi:hypothetical protein